jgi:hypothetical protein
MICRVAGHQLDRDTMMAIIAFSWNAGDIDVAIAYADRSAAAIPEDAGISCLARERR